MREVLDKLFLRLDLVSDLIQVVPAAVLAALVFAAVRLARRKKLDQRADPMREAALILFVCYLAGLLDLTIVPQNLWSSIWFYLIHGYSGESGTGGLLSGTFDFSVSVFSGLSGGAWVKTMLVGNVLMFVPLGFFLGLTARRANGKTILPMCLGASLCIELFQPIVGRGFDVDDLICNTVGGLLGFAVYLILRAAAPKLAARCRGASPGTSAPTNRPLP